MRVVWRGPGLSQYLSQAFVDLLYGCRGCPERRHNALPSSGGEARQGLGHGRHTGKIGQAMGRCNGKQINVMRLYCACETGITFDNQRHATANHVSECGRGAAGIGHRLQFDAGPNFQKQSGQMRYSPDSGRCKRDFAGMLLGAGNQLRQRFDAGLRARAYKDGKLRQRTNGKEIAGQDQRQVFGLAGKRDEQRKRRGEQRISVGDSIRCGVRRDRSTESAGRSPAPPAKSPCSPGAAPCSST